VDVFTAILIGLVPVAVVGAIFLVIQRRRGGPKSRVVWFIVFLGAMVVVTDLLAAGGMRIPDSVFRVVELVLFPVLALRIFRSWQQRGWTLPTQLFALTTLGDVALLYLNLVAPQSEPTRLGS
jgi:hypothetical protein